MTRSRRHALQLWSDEAFDLADGAHVLLQVVGPWINGRFPLKNKQKPKNEVFMRHCALASPGTLLLYVGRLWQGLGFDCGMCVSTYISLSLSPSLFSSLVLFLFSL